MPNFFYEIHSFWVALLFIGTAVGLVISLRLLARLVLPAQFGQENFDFLMRLQTMVSSICGMLLVFTLVNAASNDRSVDTLLTAEAVHIRTLDRLLVWFDSQPANERRQTLHGYVESIVQSEWPAMQDRRRSPQTDQAFQAFCNDVRTLLAQDNRPAHWSDDLVKLMEQIAEDREMRIASATISLPVQYYATVGVSLLSLCGLMALLQPSNRSIAVLSLQIAVLAALFSLVIFMDRPYAGPEGLRPIALERFLEDTSQNR
jgi:hypothetical protein